MPSVRGRPDAPRSPITLPSLSSSRPLTSVVPSGMSTTKIPAWWTTERLPGRSSSTSAKRSSLNGNRRVEHLHAELAFGGDVELDRHLHDEVGLAAVRPSGREGRRRREVRVVAARRAAIDPGDDRVDLRLRQTRVVAHLQRLRRIGAPGRHLARDDLGFDRARPRPHVVVRQQRHRGDFTRAVALRAMIEDDGRHVLGERGHVGRWAGDVGGIDPAGGHDKQCQRAEPESKRHAS